MQTTAEPNNDIVTLHLVTDACTETLPHWDRSKHKQVLSLGIGTKECTWDEPRGTYGSTESPLYSTPETEVTLCVN